MKVKVVSMTLISFKFVIIICKNQLNSLNLNSADNM